MSKTEPVVPLPEIRNGDGANAEIDGPSQAAASARPQKPWR